MQATKNSWLSQAGDHVLENHKLNISNCTKLCTVNAIANPTAAVLLAALHLGESQPPASLSATD
jgi:hypothetical protein